MKTYNTITITFKNGESQVWSAEKNEWDDYSFTGSAFIVKSMGAWVGIYNMDTIHHILVK